MIWILFHVRVIDFEERQGNEIDDPSTNMGSKSFGSISQVLRYQYASTSPSRNTGQMK